MTADAVAAYLDCSARTVRRYVAEGILSAYTLPGKRGLRFRLSEVARAMRTVPAKVARVGYGSYGAKAKITRITEPPERPVIVGQMPQGGA